LDSSMQCPCQSRGGGIIGREGGLAAAILIHKKLNTFQLLNFERANSPGSWKSMQDYDKFIPKLSLKIVRKLTTASHTHFSEFKVTHTKLHRTNILQRNEQASVIPCKIDRWSRIPGNMLGLQQFQLNL
jgi:hypothetical protein